LFHHLNTIKEQEVNVINGPKGRFYVSPNTGAKYPSITTMLGAKEKPYLAEWRNSLGVEKADKETARCADRGTAVHSMIENYLNNMGNPTKGFLPEHIREFNQVRLKLNKISEIYTQEIALFSDTLKIAGRVDCVGVYEGKLCIIDFKTSNGDKKESMIGDYFLQTTFYALAFQEMYDIQIDDLTIIMSSERGIVPLVFHSTVEEHIEPLIERINTYYKQHPVEK
jgi:ATP-dependent exoDNAse (exonuclease V) beta subunit